MSAIKRKLGLIIRLFAICLLFLMLSGVVFGVNLLAESLRGLPGWNEGDLQALPSSSIVYDWQGNEITKLRGKIYRTPIPLEQVSETMQNSMVAIEDQRFFDHRGIDYWGLGRAILNDLRGGAQEGASTITQQLVKNLLLTPEKSISRKIREAYLARQVESRYPKRKILEFYLNSIYFGEGAYGIEAASHTYFGKRAAELTLSESALLAGLPKNPSRYSPFISPDAALSRRNTVLQVLRENGYISDKQYELAVKEPLPAERHLPEDKYPYPYFLDHVISVLIDNYGLPEEQVYDGGLRIYTTLDQRVQSAMEQAYADKVNFPPGAKDRAPESAMVILDQASGSIRGLVGGREHLVRRGFNRATMLKRQPGSTIKPLVVYAPAIELGYGPATLLDDRVQKYGSSESAYAPENMGSVSYGTISMRTALNNSVNTYAVKLLKLIGVNQGYEFGKKLGLNSLNSQDKVLGLALGGLTEGLSPLELVSGYAPLANRGVKVDVHALTKVVNNRGETILELSPERHRIMKQTTADMITDLLKSVIEEGTGKGAKLEGREVAGKTGTTQLPYLPEFSHIRQGNKDAWFVGYTPEYVGAVWLGFDITDGTHYLEKVYGGSFPALIWKKVFSSVLSGTPAPRFPPPPQTMIAAERRVFSRRPPPASPTPTAPPTQKQVASSEEKKEPAVPTDTSGLLNRLFSFLQSKP